MLSAAWCRVAPGGGPRCSWPRTCSSACPPGLQPVSLLGCGTHAAAQAPGGRTRSLLLGALRLAARGACEVRSRSCGELPGRRSQFERPGRRLAALHLAAAVAGSFNPVRCCEQFRMLKVQARFPASDPHLPLPPHDCSCKTARGPTWLTVFTRSGPCCMLLA